MPLIDYYNEQDISNKIDSCMKNCDSLSRWEKKFLSSVDDMVSKRIILTRMQVRVIRKLYRKLNSNGETNV